jgi:hypothetical protein
MFGSGQIPDDFRGAAKKLDAIDLPRIGQKIGVGEDEIRAVLEVESRGSGFDKAGRPLILFEPHIFYRLLGKGVKRDRAVRAGLAYPNWGEKPYPRGSSYPRLIDAMNIDADAALKSASWGLGQIMGGNHRAAGFASVQSMVAAFCADEEHHLDAMVSFIKHNGLDDELRRHDWRGFARGYNGPGFAKHGYDKRLAAAFARWKQRPDVTFDLADVASSEQANADTAIENTRKREFGDTFLDRVRVKAVQERLKELGYHEVGMPDGVMGSRTVAAISAFQAEHEFPINGQISDHLIVEMEKAKPREVSVARATGEPEGSRIVEGATALSNAGKGLSLTGALAFAGPVLDQVEATKSVLDRIKELVAPVREFLVDHWPLLLVAGGIWIAMKGLAVRKARIEDHRSGKTS